VYNAKRRMAYGPVRRLSSGCPEADRPTDARSGHWPKGGYRAAFPQELVLHTAGHAKSSRSLVNPKMPLLLPHRSGDDGEP
jgi:hypothetical protein